MNRIGKFLLGALLATACSVSAFAQQYAVMLTTGTQDVHGAKTFRDVLSAQGQFYLPTSIVGQCLHVAAGGLVSGTGVDCGGANTFGTNGSSMTFTQPVLFSGSGTVTNSSSGGLAVTYGVTAGSATLGGSNATSALNLAGNASLQAYVGFWRNGMGSARLGYLGDLGGTYYFDTEGGGNIILKGGNVGIGTTNPGFPLQVQGVIASSATVAGGTSIHLYGNGDVPGRRNWAWKTESVTAGDIALLESASATGNPLAGTNMMEITSAGNVGIGTSSPLTTLDVNGSLQIGSGAQRSTFTASGDPSFRGIVIAGGSASGDTYGHFRGFDTSGVQRIEMNSFPGGASYINNAGGLGIGTANPSELLNINGGNMRIDTGWAAINNNSLEGVRFMDGSFSDRFWLGTDASGFAVNDRTSTGAEVFRIKNGGELDVLGSTFTVLPSGIVSAPRQPAIRSKSTTATIIPTGIETDIFFGADSFNQQFGHDVVNSSSTFTVPTGGAGVYHVQCDIDFSASATGTMRARIYRNGSTLEATGKIGTYSAGADDVVSVSADLSMSAGDTLKCKGYQDSGSNNSACSADLCRFSAVKLW